MTKIIIHSHLPKYEEAVYFAYRCLFEYEQERNGRGQVDNHVYGEYRTPNMRCDC